MFFLLEALPDGSAFALDGQTLIGIIIVLLNIGALFGILTFLLYKPVRKFLYDRHTRIVTQLKNVEERQEQANRMRAEYELKLRDADQQKENILESARALAATKTQEQLDDAKKEAEVLKERAFKEIAMERARVTDELKRSIIELSTGIAGKILARDIDKAVHDRLFNETLLELEDIAWHS